MGCWNGTCGLSSLPITWETPVRWALIVPAAYGRDDHMSTGFCRPSDHWAPITPLGHGVYDDYGGVEMQDDPSWPMKHALKVHLKIDATKDSNVRKLLCDREEGAEVDELEHDTLAARIARKKKVPRISLWMARKDVFDAVERAYPFPFAHEIEVSCFHRKHPSVEHDPEQRFARRMISADHMQFLGGRSEVNYRAGMNPLCDLIHDEEVDHERFRELACAIGEVTWLNSALHSIRRFWFPAASAGSQTDDFEQHAALAEAIRTACEGRIAQQRAWDEENDDDEDVATDANQS